MPQSYTASDIEVLKGLEPVRRRPGMYTHTSRPNHLAHEVIDNSVDEALAGFCKEISVTLYKDNSLEVADDLIGANDARFVATFDGGTATVKPGGPGDVRVDVRSLAALWSGFWTPMQLRALGAITGSDDALGTLLAAFAGGTPAMNDMF